MKTSLKYLSITPFLCFNSGIFSFSTMCLTAASTVLKPSSAQKGVVPENLQFISKINSLLLNSLDWKFAGPNAFKISATFLTCLFISGKSFIMSEIYNFLEKKHNQSKDVLDGCHWINADIGIFGTPNGKKIIHSYLEILKTLINSNVIIEKFHISDSV